MEGLCCHSWFVRGDSGRGDKTVGVVEESRLSLFWGGCDMVADVEELRLTDEAWEASSVGRGGLSSCHGVW
jgi:hypothetical protein